VEPLTSELDLSALSDMPLSPTSGPSNLGLGGQHVDPTIVEFKSVFFWLAAHAFLCSRSQNVRWRTVSLIVTHV
jgi:hypothetical protein